MVGRIEGEGMRCVELIVCIFIVFSLGWGSVARIRGYTVSRFWGGMGTSGGFY